MISTREAQLDEQRSPNPLVAGSTPAACAAGRETIRDSEQCSEDSINCGRDSNVHSARARGARPANSSTIETEMIKPPTAVEPRVPGRSSESQSGPPGTVMAATSSAGSSRASASTGGNKLPYRDQSARPMRATRLGPDPETGRASVCRHRRALGGESKSRLETSSAATRTEAGAQIRDVVRSTGGLISQNPARSTKAAGAAGHRVVGTATKTSVDNGIEESAYQSSCLDSETGNPLGAADAEMCVTDRDSSSLSRNAGQGVLRATGTEASAASEFEQLWEDDGGAA